jgi:hypothetical protein
MKRHIETWRAMDASNVAQKQHRASIALALKDARADIIELCEQRDELLAALKDAHPCIADDALRHRIGNLIANIEGGA